MTMIDPDAPAVMDGSAQILAGTEVELLATQDRYDNYFLDSPEWRAART